MLGVVAFFIGLVLILVWLYRDRKKSKSASPTASGTPRPMDWKEVVAITTAFAFTILIGIIVSRALFMA
jgi:hypothetical protein